MQCNAVSENHNGCIVQRRLGRFVRPKESTLRETGEPLMLSFVVGR